MGSTSSREMANRMEKCIDRRTYGQSLDARANQGTRDIYEFFVS